MLMLLMIFLILFLCSQSYSLVTTFLTDSIYFNINANSLQVNVKVVTPHKNEKEISVILSVQKEEHGFELTSAFTHGQHKLSVDSKFDMQPNNWNINMKVQFIQLFLFCLCVSCLQIVLSQRHTCIASKNVVSCHMLYKMLQCFCN
jgi:hypothetical protein